MGEFDAIRTKAIALIKRKGRAMVLVLDNNAAPADPSKPWNVTAGPPVEFPFKGVYADFAARGNAGMASKLIIVPGDVGVTEDQLDLTARVRVIGVAGGLTLTYGVTGVTIYAPDGIPIGWKLRCELWQSTSKAQQTNFSAP